MSKLAVLATVALGLVVAACTGDGAAEPDPVTAGTTAATGPTAEVAGPAGPIADEVPSSARCYAVMTDAPGKTGVLLFGGWADPTGDSEWQGVSAFRPDTGWAGLAEAEPEPGDVFGFDTESGRAVFLEAGGGTWAFDPATTAWDELQPEAPPAYGARMVYHSESDRLISFGGYGPGDVMIDETWAFDYETSTWTQMDPRRSPPERVWHVMAYDERSDRVVLFGGTGADGQLGDTWSYDLDTDTWTRLARGGGPEPREHAAMAYDRRTDRILLFGGVQGPFLAEEPFDDTWGFDLDTNTWTELDAQGPSARGWHVMTADAETGTLVLLGGGASRETCTDETWIFDPGANNWSEWTETASLVELDQVVLAESDPPTGTELAGEDTETAWMQPVQGSMPEVQDSIAEGNVDSLIHLFFTPGMLDAVDAGQEAVDEYAANFEGSGHWSVGSWASEYQNPKAAAAALGVILAELRSTWELRRLGDPDLGDEGAIFGGNTPLAHGTPTTIYFWRSGPYLLQVVAHGSVEADAEEIRSIAEEMQARSG